MLSTQLIQDLLYEVYFQDEMITSWKKLFGKRLQHSIIGRLKVGLKLNPNNVCLNKREPTTKFCPSCAVLNTIKLSDRIYNCECGYSNDRDTHSAQNMITIGSGRAYVESETSVFECLFDIQSKFLTVKREANGFSRW